MIRNRIEDIKSMLKTERAGSDVIAVMISQMRDSQELEVVRSVLEDDVLCMLPSIDSTTD